MKSIGRICIASVLIAVIACGFCNTTNEQPGPESHLEIPIWKQAVDRLPLRSYAQTFDGEGNRVYTSHPYKVTAPDIGVELDDFGKYMLHELRMCREQIEQLLGVGPYLGETLAMKSSINPENPGGSCCGKAPDYEISARLPRLEDFTQSVLPNDAYWKRADIDYDVCQGGHEETHRFVMGTGIPHHFNEGLAQYVGHHFNDMPGTPAATNLKVCESDGFYLSGDTFGFSSEQKIPYRKIDTAQFGEYPKVFSYYTATCFWDHIERAYGHAAFQAIIRNLYLIADTPRKNYFLEDAVYPVVGKEIKSYLRAMLEVVPD